MNIGELIRKFYEESKKEDTDKIKDIIDNDRMTCEYYSKLAPMEQLKVKLDLHLLEYHHSEYKATDIMKKLEKPLTRVECYIAERKTGKRVTAIFDTYNDIRANCEIVKNKQSNWSRIYRYVRDEYVLVGNDYVLKE